MQRTKKLSIGKERQQYLLALGRFIDLYSSTEGMWHWAIRTFSGIDEKVARAMTGGMRGGEVIATLKKVMHASDVDDVRTNGIDSLIEQFNSIQEFRNRLIHRSAKFDSRISAHISTNEEFYRIFEDFERVVFRVVDINNATEDLVRIILRILFWMLPDEKIIPHELFRLHEPWSYKRLPLETPNRTHRAKSAPIQKRVRRE